MTNIIKKPINYLNNKDILKEIHLSKNSYCSFLSKDDHQYDLIIDLADTSIEQKLEHLLKPEVIASAKEIRAKRLSSETGNIVVPDSIPTSDLIFRVMCWSHIPLAPKQPRKVVKKKSAKDLFEFDEEFDDVFSELEDVAPIKEIDDMVHMRVNFPPFQHFKIREDNTVYCVGKSHWKGDLESGEFSKDHGTLTKTLAKMYMMICEKYSMKFNWRGYSYVDEMRGSALLQLTYIGLRFNEAKSENPFAYYTQAVTNSFCRILNIEKRNQNIRDDILELNNLNPSWSRMNNQDLAFFDE